MLERAIPRSGEPLPIIGLGTWQTFDVGHHADARTRLSGVLGEFVAQGGTLVDSSPMYGSSESVVGDLVERLGLRARLFIATKVWTTGRQAGERQMRESMNKLRSDPIDLMQVHNLQDVGTHLATMRAWKGEGRIRYIGVTHYNAAGHAALARVLRVETIDFVQVNYSVAEREAERELLPLAAERGVAVIVNRPFAEGALLRRLQAKPLPGWAADIACTSWPQLLMKFVISHPAVTCAIPATSSVEHLRDNMIAGREPMPDTAMRERIAAAVA
jgi:aryl-alcohol dehydrogenase-like predicted oxidoreductase